MTDNSTIPLTITQLDLERRLGVSRATIYRWVSRGLLVPLKWSRRNKIYNFQDVLTFIKTPEKSK